MRRYKVVNWERMSAIVSGKARVLYRAGEFVTAPPSLAEKGYHLSVFSDLQAATRFAEEMETPSNSIWSCECEEEVPLPQICNTYDLYNGRLYPRPEGIRWPVGTKMFKRVMLLEETVLGRAA